MERWRNGQDRGALRRRRAMMSPADRVAFLDRECGGDDSLDPRFSTCSNKATEPTEKASSTARTLARRTHGIASQGLRRSRSLRKPSRAQARRHGVIYKAWDVKLGREVAYKVMNAAPGKDDEFRRKFAREAKITARLQYPGIVPSSNGDRRLRTTGLHDASSRGRTSET